MSTATDTTAKHEVPVVTKISDRDIENLVITAVEHMGHGCLTYRLTEAQRSEHGGPDTPYSVTVARTLLADQRVVITDRWDYNEAGLIRLDKMLEAIGTEATRRGKDVRAFLDNADVIDADCVMQVAAWGKIVLG